ncbi:MAG: amino acid adenylation domain-containing protein [Anditalea sp.]
MEPKPRSMPLLHELFEGALKGFEDTVAVVYDDQHITYKELDHRAEGLSRAILHHANGEEIIGINTTRSLEMIVSLLAILKSGKAYLPLDPGFPENRLGQVVSNSGIKYCVSGPLGKEVFQKLGMEVIPQDTPYPFPEQTVVRQNPNACVLYTSGSTGKPKGVCVPHRGLVNFLLWQKEHSKAGPYLKTLQFCHLGFDVSIEEIFVPLITGGTLYLINDTYRLDSGNLLAFVDKNSINRIYLPYVELQYFAEEAVRENFFPSTLIEVLTGGELLKITPQIAAFFHALPHCPLKNKYGPTEACVWVTELELDGNALDWSEIPTIGKAIAHTQIFMLNEKSEQVPDGEVGEICIHGTCVANGYLNEPGLTAGSFINWTDKSNTEVRLYKTGDLGKYLPDGNIEFHGRRDGQVKIRGNRIELADIEIGLAQQKGVQQAVVVAREDVPGKKYLAAYLVNREREINIKQLRENLIGLLPDYMIPSYFIQLDGLPKTPSGKVDRKLLPKPEAKRPDFGVLYKKPATETERNIARALTDILQFDKVGADDNFFELGGNSLLAQKTISELKHRFKYILPITKLYQFPTIKGMAGYIESSQFPSKQQGETVRKQKPKDQDNDIAVIAMSVRFPGANTIGELWEVLKNGKETLRFFREDELDPAVPHSLRTDPLYVKARGIIKDVDRFDPEFFGINPKLAELMDPQQRVFMEISWEALENAGYFPQNGHGNTGVFAGVYNNTYFLNNVQHNKDLVDQVGEFQVMSANEKDFVASRTAYHLDLKGPAVSLYSACSTSLLAIAQAVESLRKGQCELALAGGASVNSPVNSGHLYQEGAMLSSNGHCCPFDADSTGTLFCDGAGVVLLKNLRKAKEDGDTIHAVIKGVGVNNDGGGKGSFTAPSAEGQAGAISMAINDAQMDPAFIGYVEAHGTGTPLGDPIEMEGLGLAFGPQLEKQYCAIGSVKSNMGHLTAAAGVAGFIKTVLALRHQQIPPSLGYARPNPNIDFKNSPFYVNQKLQDWKSEGPRRAGVSSFGVGGTNVHVVLEEADKETTAYGAGRDVQLITWSAKSVQGLEAYGKKLLDFSKGRPDPELADMAYTLQTARASFNHRRFLVASSTEELSQQLAGPSRIHETNSLRERPGETVFSFPGQGAQYLNMGRDLYEGEETYRNAVDTCAEKLKEYMGMDIRKVIFPATLDQGAEDGLKDTRYAQPALFVTGYALAQLWISWGVRPSILCGHSIGEFVAAHLAGVFSLEDALKLIAARGSMIGNLPRGSMLSVRAGVDEVEKILPRELSVAAINTSHLCVLSGTDEDIAIFAQELDKKEIPNRLLHTSHAFHSSMMDPVVEDFKEIVASVALKNPQKPIISTVTGTWLKDGQATDPRYWAEHIRKTVDFAAALDTISTLDNPLFIEAGPGNVTSTLAKQQISGRNVPIITSLERVGDQSEHKGLLKALGQVWLNGIEPDWTAFYAGHKRRKLDLPNYAFNKRRCWVDPPSLPTAIPAEKANIVATESRGPAPIGPEKGKSSRAEKLVDRIRELLGTCGIEMHGTSMSFLEMGLDSLLLTQVALTFKKEFNLPITFRQLNEEYSTPALLVEYLDQNLPEGAYQEQAVPLGTETVQDGPPMSSLPDDPGDLHAAMGLMSQQLQQLSKQMALIQDQLLKGPLQTGVTGSPQPAAPLDFISNGDKKTMARQGAIRETKKTVADMNEKKERGDRNSGFSEKSDNHFMAPPVPGARLGKDQNGNPAWFMANPDQPGSYFQIID